LLLLLSVKLVNQNLWLGPYQTLAKKEIKTAKNQNKQVKSEH